MSSSNLTTVTSVLPVKDHAAAVKWYRMWIGRDPDLTPAEGVAEWKLAENAWIQVSVDPEPAGKTTVVIGVHDIEAQRDACVAAGVSVSEVTDYGFLKIAEAADPEGNKVVFSQIVQEG